MESLEFGGKFLGTKHSPSLGTKQWPRMSDCQVLVPDARYRARTWLQLFSFLRKSGIGWYAFG